MPKLSLAAACRYAVLVVAPLVGLIGSPMLRAAEGEAGANGTNDSAPKASAPANDPAFGRTVADFSLRDFRGKTHALSQYADKKAVVLVFLGTDCPLAKIYAPRLADLGRQFADRGIALLGIDANVQDTPTKIGLFAQAHKVDFPLLVDAGNVVADAIGAARTPEVFVLDAQRTVRYHGRIDDQYSVGVQQTQAKNRDLATALEELLAGKSIGKPSTPFTGCVIARVRKVEPHGDITYAKHVARIVNAHCIECHREGELAPFTLASYQDMANWSGTIREVVAENRMPPWFADAKHGKFANDCSLNSTDKQTLLTWIDNGCPEGNPADLPTPPTFTTGWRIGKPDVVYRMPKPYTVPAEGTVEYQHFVMEPELQEDAWISAAEARPGNPAVVHHIVLFAVPPGAQMRDLSEAQRVGRMIAIYSPGMNPWLYPAGAALKVEKGTKFIIQSHYTPNGSSQDDLSYVGLKFVDAKTVKRTVRYGMVVNAAFEIPPGADNKEVVARHKFPKDFMLLNLFPHMHFRGKSFRFEAEYPDGNREVLLDVPHYDFNWQLRYDLATPKLMPKGTQLIVTGHFDNSAANPLNPDPTATVRFGLQSWEEMLVGYYTIMPVEEDNVATKPAASAAGQ